MPADKRFNPDELKQLLQNKYGTGVRVEVFPKAEREGTGEEPAREPADHRDLTFDYRPSQIKEYLDRFVIQQDQAKKVLSTAICDHYHHIQNCSDSDECREYKKQNIIIIGPTGVGKTYLIQNIARLIGVPFCKADATRYSETGYVGGDVEDLVRELVQQANDDVGLAEYGIVYLDEIDKIAGPTGVIGRDVSGHGVQRGLLKLMEETEVPLRSPTDIASQMQSLMEIQSGRKPEKKTINTKHILFIVSGAFNGLTEIVGKRLGSRKIGFMGGEQEADRKEELLLQQVRSTDFVEYGFESEFIGRLPVVTHCRRLSVDDLFQILKRSEGSLLKQYKKDFLAYGIDAYFKDGAMRALAALAEREETGARGLMTVCERVFRDFKYQLPDHEVTELVADRKLVEDPKAALKELLATPDLHHEAILQFQLKRFEAEFYKRYGVEISFTPEAVALISERVRGPNADVLQYCRDLFREYEHGMKLLARGQASKPLSVGPQVIEDPAGSLEKWIRETYK
ncbi:MAG: AAA family ATPase [Acidobacteriota bacterium]|nr:AAA family ATPase [Acidobacteriota bacterium]